MAFVKMLPKVEKKKWIIKAGVEQVPVKWSMGIYRKSTNPLGYLQVQDAEGSGWLAYDLAIDFSKYTKMVVVGWGRDELYFARGRASAADLMGSPERTKFPTNRGSFSDPITLESVFVNPSTNKPDYKYPTFYNYGYGGDKWFYIIDAWIE